MKNAEGNLHDPITYKVFSPHIHIVFLKNTVRFLSFFLGGVSLMTDTVYLLLFREMCSTWHPFSCSRSNPRHGGIW